MDHHDEENILKNSHMHEHETEIDHKGEEPSKLAVKLSKVLAKLSEENADSDSDAARYRDVELEKELKEQKEREEEIERELTEQQRTKDQERELIEDIRGEDHHQKTKEETENDAKILKKKARKLSKAFGIEEITKQRKRREEEINEYAKYNKKGGLLNAVKNIVKKINAYRMHSLNTPGRQAGVFDNFVEKANDRAHKVSHDFDMGSEIITKDFKTEVNGVEVTGHISQRFDDNSSGKMTAVSEASVSIERTSSHGQNVPKESLGKISATDIVQQAIRNGGISR